MLQLVVFCELGTRKDSFMNPRWGTITEEPAIVILDREKVHDLLREQVHLGAMPRLDEGAHDPQE